MTLADRGGERGAMPAYPILERIAELPKFERLAGLSVREYFAAMALNGLLAADGRDGETWERGAAAKRAVAEADAPLAALSGGRT